MSKSLEAKSETADVTLTEAAERLGVHYMTAYRYVRTGRMLAQKRSGQWWVTDSDLAAVLAEGTGARRRLNVGDGGARAFPVASFTDRLIAGDTAGCWDIIEDELSAGAAPPQVHNELLRPALRSVGEAWRAGNLGVADEHRATSSAYRLLGQLGPHFRHRGRRRGTVVIGACAGDMHALPSAMLADCLSDRRFDVVDLGANTPAESFIDVAQHTDDLIGIGLCAVIDHVVPGAVHQAEQIRVALPEVYLLVGGPAIAAAAARFTHVADHVSLDARLACDAFEEAAGARTAPSEQ